MPLDATLSAARSGSIGRFLTTLLTPHYAPVWLWLMIGLICCVRAYFSPPARHSVYPNYSQAGRSWVQGTDAYRLERDSSGAVVRHMSAYRYAPPVSVLYVPFSLLPDDLGGVVWRLFNYVCFLGAFAWFVREALPQAESWGPSGIAAFWLLLVPLSVSSMNNGQANVLLMALILGAGTAAVQQRWNLTAIFLAGACILKLYPLAVALLMVAAYPRQLGWRFPLALAVGLAFPFAMQSPHYVIEQYGNWIQLLLVDNRLTFPMREGYRDFYLLTRFIDAPMAPNNYMILQLGAAAVVAGVCLFERWRGLPRFHVIQTILCLGCCWMTVFGPSIESCTFILIAPPLAWALVDAFQPGRPLWSRWALVLIFILFLANITVAWFPDGRNWLYGLQPLAALLFFLERFAMTLSSLTGGIRAAHPAD